MTCGDCTSSSMDTRFQCTQCKGFAHCGCVGCTETAAKNINKCGVKNLCWFCDECGTTVQESLRPNSPSLIEKISPILNQISEQVEKNCKEISRLTELFEADKVIGTHPKNGPRLNKRRDNRRKNGAKAPLPGMGEEAANTSENALAGSAIPADVSDKVHLNEPPHEPQQTHPNESIAGDIMDWRVIGKKGRVCRGATDALGTTPSLPIAKSRFSKVKRLFITRLAATVTAQDVAKLVSEKIGVDSNCIKLPTRYASYSSFCVEIDEVNMETVLLSECWPEGMLIRGFSGIPPRPKAHSPAPKNGVNRAAARNRR